jgi:BirA family transcriptional regulator, biotin operon repressor / biotin---[acetyl-CoA-carboxylase] ligase
MRFKIYNYKVIKSTNDIAMKLIKKNKNSGCVLAKNQTKGRGTKGKKWISKEGNLFISIFFHLKKKYPPFNEFSIVNSIIVSNVIKNYCKKSSVSLKFPNDILVNKKKICGILQEIITLRKKKFLIIGIGLNILSNPKFNDKYKATNIFNESKKKPTNVEVVKKIVISYENFFKDLKNYSFKEFNKRSNSIAYKL